MLTLVGEITRIECDSAGAAERAVEIRRRPSPGRGGRPVTVEEKRRLEMRRVADDRTARIDRAIGAAINVGGEGN